MQNSAIVISKCSSNLPVELKFWFGLPNGVDSFIVVGRLDVACPGQNSSLLRVTILIRK